MRAARPLAVASVGNPSGWPRANTNRRSRPAATTARAILIVAAFLLLAPGRAAGADKPFSFAVIADPQLGMVELERDTRNFARVADAIVALPQAERPSVVLIAGDLVNTAGDAEQLRRFAEVKARFTMPVWVVPGNHDLTRDGKTLAPDLLARFRREWAPDRFARRKNGCVFIGLDSQLWFSEEAASEQLQWLESQLRKAQRRPIFLLQHHPLYVQAADEADAYWNTPRTWRERVLALLERFGVRAVLTGHYHRNASLRWHGISLLTTPSTCKNFDDSPHGYRLMTLDPDGAMTDVIREVPAAAR